MKRFIPWITGIVIAGGLAWGFLYLKSHFHLGVPGSKPAEEMKGLAIQFQDTTLVGWAHGKRVWKFHAKTLAVSKDRTTATFSGIKSGVMLKDDKPVASLTADRVVYNTYTRNVDVPGAAKIQLKDGPTIKAGDLHWSARDSRLVSQKGLDATFSFGTLHGQNLQADLHNREISMNKVSGTLKVE